MKIESLYDNSLILNINTHLYCFSEIEEGDSNNLEVGLVSNANNKKELEELTNTSPKEGVDIEIEDE